MGKNSDNYFQRAQEIIPGGVNSPVRAFRAVGGTPLFIEQAQGARIFDADNLQYIDCVGSWGPMILGRSEEHTSELQSQSNLVCRLLLEKKNFARHRVFDQRIGDGAPIAARVILL